MEKRIIHNLSQQKNGGEEYTSEKENTGDLPPIRATKQINPSSGQAKQQQAPVAEEKKVASKPSNKSAKPKDYREWEK